jgi:hypothetical protein
MSFDPKRLSYEIEDSNDNLLVLVDRQPAFSMEINHDKHDGYYYDDDFATAYYDAYGAENLERIKDLAMADLERYHTEEYNKKHFDESPNEQLLFDIYSNLIGKNPDPKKILATLNKHFEGKDLRLLQRSLNNQLNQS